MTPHKNEQGRPFGEGDKALFQRLEELETKLVEQEAKLKEQEKTASEFREIAQRVQAEFENFAKRIEREKKEHKEFAAAGVIEDLLPVLDSFESALGTMKKSDPQGAHGLELLSKQLWKVLERHGLKKIEAVGKKFDPQMHECYISESRADLGDELVTEEIQKGYLLNGRVLRASKVKINKKHANEKE